MPLKSEQVKAGFVHWLAIHYPDNADSLYSFFFGPNHFVSNEATASAARGATTDVISDDEAASITSDYGEIPLYQLLKSALPPSPDQADTAKQMAEIFVNSFLCRKLTV